MSSNKKKLILNTVSVSLGCNSCKKLKLTSFFNPKPKSKSKPKPELESRSYKTTHSLYNYSSSNSSTKTTHCSSTHSLDNYSSSNSSMKTTHCSFSEYETAASFSSSTGTNQYWDMDTETDKGTKRSMVTVRGFGRVGGESLAVEKDSDDPYLDFRHSMLQMILEKEIYSKDDLKELLNCFLRLNSPYHHGIIVRAFTEIWNGVFSVKPVTVASPKLRSGFRPRDF